MKKKRNSGQEDPKKEGKGQSRKRKEKHGQEGKGINPWENGK